MLVNRRIKDTHLSFFSFGLSEDFTAETVVGVAEATVTAVPGTPNALLGLLLHAAVILAEAELTKTLDATPVTL